MRPAKRVSQPCQHLQPGGRSMHHGHSYRPVQRDHGTGRNGFKDCVQGEDLRPVSLLIGGGLRVHSGDGCLKLIWPGGPASQDGGQQRDALFNLHLVPEPSVLFRQRDGCSVWQRTRRTPGIGQQHKGQQAHGLELTRCDSHQQARNPDGFSGQLLALERRTRACRVTLVENQVQHVKYDAEPCLALGSRRHAERGSRLLDPLFRAADALSHGRFGDQESRGNFRRRESTDGPER